MLAVKAIYENGAVILPYPMQTNRRVAVIVTFLEEMDEKADNKLDMKSFSFSESREILKNYTGSLTDAIIEERQSEI